MKNDGYSLVELMIVVAIIGILSTYAVFNYSASGARLNGTVRELFGNMQKLRMEAIRGNATGVVIFNPGADTYTVFLDDGPGAAGGNWALDASDTFLGVISMPSSVDLVSTTIPFNTYGYSSQGITHSAITVGNYDVKFKNDQDKYLGVRMSAAGGLRVIEGTNNGTVWQ